VLLSGGNAVQYLAIHLPPPRKYVLEHILLACSHTVTRTAKACVKPTVFRAGTTLGFAKQMPGTGGGALARELNAWRKLDFSP
jgi:hypothetical protein